MFCKNCGEQLPSDMAVICVRCGTAKGQGENFCMNCGKPVALGASVCMNCVVATHSTYGMSDKSRLVAGLFGIFLGAFGAHNFYLGYTNKALVQLLCSLGGILLSCFILPIFVTVGIGIWGFVEGVMILCNKVDTDAQGRRLLE